MITTVVDELHVDAAVSELEGIGLCHRDNLFCSFTGRGGDGRRSWGDGRKREADGLVDEGRRKLSPA